jgi:hypothetical protein
VQPGFVITPAHSKSSKSDLENKEPDSVSLRITSRRGLLMRVFRLVPVCISVLAMTVGGLAFGQTRGGVWEKYYPIAGNASLTLRTGDTSTEVRSCGCRQIHVLVDWNDRSPQDYEVTEFRTGDHVNFELKETAHSSIRVWMGNRHAPHVTVETPSELELEAQTVDGSLKVSGLQGHIELRTGDGAVDVSDVSGSLRLNANDGAISIHNVTGTLETRSTDGHVTIEGRFTSLQVHTSDGALDLTLADGSQLTAASRVEASDGHVTIKLPRTMAVDLDVHSSDGQIRCSLPLTVEGYNSDHSSGRDLRGRLNGGGVPLTIHTGDGSVTIASL